MLRKILTEPDPILRKKCEPLEKVDEETKKLMDFPQRYQTFI